MEENRMDFSGLITVRNILRLAALFCIICVFCPACMVSCAGVEVKIGVMSAVTGIKKYGEYVVEPTPGMLIYLIVPVAILVLLFMQRKKKVMELSVLALSLYDLFQWEMFRIILKNYAEENYCDFETTGWFTVNIIALLVISIMTVLALVGRVNWDGCLLNSTNRDRGRRTLDQMSAATGRMSATISHFAGSAASAVGAAAASGRKMHGADTIGYCATCGSPIAYGCRFCTACGTPVSQSIIEEAEQARAAANEGRQASAGEKQKEESGSNIAE